MTSQSNANSDQTEVEESQALCQKLISARQMGVSALKASMGVTSRDDLISNQGNKLVGADETRDFNTPKIFAPAFAAHHRRL